MGQRVDQLSIQILGVPSAPHAIVDQLSFQLLTRVINPVHALSGYLKDNLVNHVLRSSTYAKPLGLWIALYTIPPSDTDPGTEVVGNGYDRVRLNPSESNWTAPASGNGQTTNGVDIVFPTPTGPWGTVVGYSVLDAPLGSGGNLIGFSTIATPQSVTIGSNPRFLAGDLSLTFA